MCCCVANLLLSSLCSFFVFAFVAGLYHNSIKLTCCMLVVLQVSYHESVTMCATAYCTSYPCVLTVAEGASIMATNQHNHQLQVHLDIIYMKLC
ncbi:unnamed protein product [Amaranthus hypochondriacus]